MIVVSASLVVIALIGLTIGANVLYGDHLQRTNTEQFKECKANDFSTPDCQKYCDRINTEVSGVYSENCE